MGKWSYFKSIKWKYSWYYYYYYIESKISKYFNKDSKILQFVDSYRGRIRTVVTTMDKDYIEKYDNSPYSYNVF